MSNDNVVWRKKSGGDLTIAETNSVVSIDTARDSGQADAESRKFKNINLSGVEDDSDSLPSNGCSSSSNINERFFKNATMNATSMFACTQSACSQMICNPLREMVSQNRRRYLADGFNLDLTYITDRIIAMGYPANATESIYRNSMTNTAKFLEHYHAGHYKVFNLRGQYVYNASKFQNRVATYEMTDHHPPRLDLMAPFCREVDEYLCADPRNIVAVHCKAGKGRTGVMICAYLCYISFYHTPRQNMDYYSIIRTHNNKGVTIPSQRRYVYYFSHLREKKLDYIPLRVELVGIYIERPPKLTGKLSKLSKGALRICVTNGDVDVFDSDELWLSNEQIEKEDELHQLYPVSTDDESYDPNFIQQTTKNCVSRRCYGWTVPSTKRVFLEGDVRINLVQNYHLKFINMNRESKNIGHIWFNTMFTCPGFSGGKYIHGDEIYRICDNEIVHRIRTPEIPNESVKRKSQKTDVARYKRRHGGRSNSSETSKKKMSGISYCSAPLAVLGDKPTLFRNPFITKYVCVKCGRRTRRSMIAVPTKGPETRRVESEPNCLEFASSNMKRSINLSDTTTDKAQALPPSGRLDVSLLPNKAEAVDYQSRSPSPFNSSSNSSSTESFSESLASSTSNVELPSRYENPSKACADRTTEALPICQSCAKSPTVYPSSFSSLLQRLSKQAGEQNSKIDCLPADESVEDAVDDELNDKIVVDEPPGLNAHCPEESLRQIYPHVRQAPRYGIVEILRDACRRDLTPKLEPTAASPPTGPIVPRAQVGRPNAESKPRCLIRRPNEHVSLYNVNEIDKAYKSRDLDPEFKIFIVTKCIDECNGVDVQLANSFIDATKNSQIEKDHKQTQKMEMKQKKMYPNQEPQPEPQLPNDRGDQFNDSTQQLNFRDSLSTTDSVSSTTTASTSSTSSAYPRDSGLSASPKNNSDTPNPGLHNYFFRQRMTSKDVHYHCPLRTPNRTICKKYGCESIAMPKPIAHTAMIDNQTDDSHPADDRTSGARHSSICSENSVEGPNDTLTNINSANESTHTVTRTLTNPSGDTVTHLNPNKTIVDERSDDAEDCIISSDDRQSSTSDNDYIKNDMVSGVYFKLNTVEENLIFDEFDFAPRNSPAAACHSRPAEGKCVQ